MTGDWLNVALVIGAVYRITRFVVADAFPPMAHFRDWVAGRFGEESSIAYLVECPWCMSVWLGGLVVLASTLLLDRGLPAPLLVWPTASGVAGLAHLLTEAAEEAVE